MIATVYIVLFVLAVLAVTYPEEFPALVRNPQQLIDAIGMESRRRWLLLKLGTQLWFSKKQLQFSLWKAKPIIEAERLKQKQQEETKVD